MLAAPFFERLVQLFHQLALVFGELDRCFHRHVAIQVARIAGPHAFDALAAQPEGFAVLRAFGNVDAGFAAQGGHVNFATQRGRTHVDGHLAVQIVAITLEDVVLAQPDLDEQVACRATVVSGFTVARAADAHAIVDACGNLDFEGLVFLDLALAIAGHAGLGNDLARAVAVRAGLLHAEKPLAHLHRARTVAGRAGFGRCTGLGSCAVAGFALVPGWNADLRFFARSRFFQGDFHRVRQVVAPVHLSASARATARPASENVTKNVAETFAKSTEAFGSAWAAAHVGIHARVTVLVIGCPLLRIAEHFVGFFGFLEFFFGSLGCITLIAVRVVFHGELAVRLFDVVVAGVFGNAQHFIEISFGHVLLP